MSDPIRVTRKELYDAVWSAPLMQVAKDYNVSDVAIRKRCIRNDIPLPPQGYRNSKTRSDLQKPPLPGDPAIAMVIVPDNRGGKRALMNPTPVLGAKGLDKNDIVVKFRRTLKDAHPLVQKTNVILNKGKVAHDGILVSKRDRAPLMVQVSKESLDRALRFMDGIIRTLEALDVKVDERGAHVGQVRLWRSARAQLTQRGPGRFPEGERKNGPRPISGKWTGPVPGIDRPLGKNRAGFLFEW